MNKWYYIIHQNKYYWKASHEIKLRLIWGLSGAYIRNPVKNEAIFEKCKKRGKKII